MKSPDPKQDGSMVAAIERYRSRRQRLSEGFQDKKPLCLQVGGTGGSYEFMTCEQ